MARQTYRQTPIDQVNRRASSESNEIRPLIDDDDRESNPRNSPLILAVSETGPSESDTQLFRHGILVALLNIDGFVVSDFCTSFERRNQRHRLSRFKCASFLFWLLFAHDRNGIYYELQFLDTVLLYGQVRMSLFVRS